MDATELLKALSRQLQSFHVSTFYLNGPPGSGKSHLLHELSQQLVKLPMRVQAIGPVEVVGNSLGDLGYEILLDCYHSGFLDNSQASIPRLDFVDSWKWLKAKALVSAEQRFVVLLDLSSSSLNDISTTSNLFSQMRFLEGMWDSRAVQPHLIVTGYWDQSRLKAHYDALNVSFPYTEVYNYAVWAGTSPDEMVNLAAKNGDNENFEIVGRTLHELVGGHPGAARDILANAPRGRVNLHFLLDAVCATAFDGRQSLKLIECWQRLPENARSLLSELVLRRHIVVSPMSESVDSLITAGIARIDRVGHRSVLGFSSWYAELVVRLHAADLGVSNHVIDEVLCKELIPEISVINQEAYRLINDIENQARNFATVQLRLGQPSQFDRHVLQNIVPRYDDRTSRTEDAYERSVTWKTRSAKAGLPVDLNPLISYCSTRDLASIIEELAQDLGSSSWTKIAEAINKLSGIRDAVMHNQFIDIDELGTLYDLQTAIADALSEYLL